MLIKSIVEMINNTSVSRFVKDGVQIEAKYIDGDDDEYRWFQGLVKRIRRYNADSYGRYVECDVLYDDGAYVKGERFYDCDYGDDVWRFGSHLAPLVQNLLSKIEQLEYDKYFDDDDDYKIEEDDTSDTDDDGDDECDGDGDEISDSDNDVCECDCDDDDTAYDSSNDGGDGKDETDANEVINDVVRQVKRNNRRVSALIKVIVAAACASVTTALIVCKSQTKCISPFV
jgi:hypothetical protein